MFLCWKLGIWHMGWGTQWPSICFGISETSEILQNFPIFQEMKSLQIYVCDKFCSFEYSKPLNRFWFLWILDCPYYYCCIPPPPQTTKQVRAPIFFRKNDFLRATKIHAGRGTQVRRVMQSVSSSPDMNTMHLFWFKLKFPVITWTLVICNTEIYLILQHFFLQNAFKYR